MKLTNTNILKACKKHIKETQKKPNSFSQEFKINDKSYVYMSEVDPHIDDWRGSETKWNIIFHAIKEDFYFIYRLDGKLHTIKPEIGKIYTFEFKKYHALLHKDNVKLFQKRKHWLNWEPENKLICIFEFID